ncbi:histidine kinase [Pseudomonas sp. JQ170]|uniref:histidine kinase n=1 Tax=unclassified Pseudomonas TaxID=196821 RepID=UPI002654011F|nr:MULTISPECIES: histidine kinase [unclassified Pseudomonas]MDN7142841.1 histidine kinase [Pseudomonas sp. JQ170]WRO78816.1 histidine kinase [Pseudomonas sp. 170C]
MTIDSLNSSALQDFLVDAQVLLTKAEECLQHLELIDNDPDACHCLNDTLATLVARAQGLELLEVAGYCRQLQQLLASAQAPVHLPEGALTAIQDCLTLLAWQLELVDPRTGRLNLDTEEQVVLLDNLATALHPPQACASCTLDMSPCEHPAQAPKMAIERSTTVN